MTPCIRATVLAFLLLLTGVGPIIWAGVALPALDMADDLRDHSLVPGANTGEGGSTRMRGFQSAKAVFRRYADALDAATPATVARTLQACVTSDYRFRSVHPFRAIEGGAEAVAEQFWAPLLEAFPVRQRRPDIFIAGINEFSKHAPETWVMSMGHVLGLFDHDFLGIPRTRRIAMLRYAEFARVEGEAVAETGLFLDVIGLMAQAGVYPLPPSTGVYFPYPGPRTHDGLLYADAPPAEGSATLDLVNRMVADLTELNRSGSMDCPPEILEKTWHPDMLWYGPAGIGATYTIPRYQEQHQPPFRANLADKQGLGHVCRFAEGHYACFFGWPNLRNRPIGGFLGLPGGNVTADMQVVDVYRREGDKLAENWVFIDLPHWLQQQGLDVLGRTSGILNPHRP
jgi:hypothetical protein